MFIFFLPTFLTSLNCFENCLLFSSKHHYYVLLESFFYLSETFWYSFLLNSFCSSLISSRICCFFPSFCVFQIHLKNFFFPAFVFQLLLGTFFCSYFCPTAIFHFFSYFSRIFIALLFPTGFF